MTKTLKDKTITGLLWSFADNFFNLGFQFIVGIILARLLSPKEFGLIGIITVFIVIIQVLIDSGFNQALIRKTTVEEKDYCTAFYSNFTAALFFYLVFFLTSPWISSFFGEPQLEELIKIVGLVIIINSFSLIPMVIITRNINFKLRMNVSIVSSVISGIIGITMAYNGYGVWSLVGKTVSQSVLTVVFLYLWSFWRPRLLFSRSSFRELFSFGSNMLLASLIDQIFTNSYYIIVGKFFSVTELGYYTRADQFKKLPSENLTGIIQRVSYPALSSLQDNPEKLKYFFSKLIKNAMFISFVSMMGMASVADLIIIVLIGPRWMPCVPYLRLLCFVGMLYPLHSLNLNLLMVKGRSDLFLKLEFFKKGLAIPALTIGVFFGIKEMIVTMIINSFISLVINTYWSGKLAGYSYKDQIKDVAPSFLIAAVMSASVFLCSHFIPIDNNILKLALMVSLGAIIVLLLSRLIRLEPYHDMKDIAVTYFNKMKK